ncbi:MAG: hypothetical protein WAX69_07225 [Victivallales bacterium]
MIKCKHPLLKTKSGKPFLHPAKFADAEDFDNQNILMTKTGSKVQKDKADWIDLNGIGKWLGGVHLRKGNIWRWDDNAGKILKT